MRGEIRRICKAAGTTTLYVTHDQKEALSIAERIAVMFDGRIVQIGTPRLLYERPATAAVAGFIGETNLVSATIVARAGDRVTCRLPFGQIAAAAGADLATDATRAVCSIRPEAVQPAGAADGIEADVKSRTYLGELEQMVLAVAGVELRATVLNPGLVAEKADRVRIRFDPAGVLAFAEGGR
jgi:ABC-type Fe3+/spermidine/putrescine transport system ATPase subunit